MSRLFRISLLATLLIALLSPIFLVSPVLADLSPSATEACQGLTGIDSNATAGCNNPDSTGSTLGNVLNVAINVISIVLGAVAVIMIIVGGIKYTTSGGDQNNLESAKNTIIYALVGLVIAALAQVLIHFVINRVATSSSTNPPASSSTGQ